MSARWRSVLTTATPPVETVRHYRLLERLGAGGMGVVYKAEDTKLGRTVALKFLPPELIGDDEAKQRFFIEARAAARLDHPNICTIYETGEAENGTLYIAMAFYEGETLDRRIARGQVPIATALDIIRQVAQGLAHAHAAGIVHRDVKPGNIILTSSGIAKVLDFGLAKLTDTSMTRSRTTVGTAAYMAPEQIEGQKVTPATDVWALGVIFFEMLTGTRPFHGEYEQALFYSTLNSSPPLIRDIRPDIPLQLEKVVQRMLSKEPAERFPSMSEVIDSISDSSSPSAARIEPDAVRSHKVGRASWIDDSPGSQRTTAQRWVRPASIAAALSIAFLLVLLFAFNIGDWRDHLWRGAETRPIQSLAVLPLANLSGDPTQEYFADGMTEEVITTLGQISALRVISRQSVVQYRRTQKTVPEIARELNVDGVVEGTVLRSGDRIRITAQLIQAKPEKRLWGERYERDLRDVLSLQSEIAQAIAGRVNATVTPEERARLASTHEVDPTAQAAYLKGRYFVNRWPGDDFAQCASYLEAATATDPSYAKAYGALAMCFSLMPWCRPPKVVFPKAEIAARKSLEIDDNLSEGHVALGSVQLFFDWNWASAEKELVRGIDLNPSSATAHGAYSGVLLFTSRFDDAIAEARKAVDLDPASLLANRNLTFVYMMSRHYKDAVAQANITLQLAPSVTLAQVDLVTAYLFSGSTEEAHAVARRFQLTGHPLFAEPGKDDEALARIDRQGWIKATAQGSGVEDSKPYADPFYIAMQYARLGEKKLALDWLDTAYNERSAMMVQLNVSPFMDDLRAEPRFKELVKRMNFPPVK